MPKIDLNEIGGLWVILASCIGLGIAWNILTWGVARLVEARYGPSTPPLAGASGARSVAHTGTLTPHSKSGEAGSARATPGTLSPVAMKYACTSLETNGLSFSSARCGSWEMCGGSAGGSVGPGEGLSRRRSTCVHQCIWRQMGCPSAPASVGMWGMWV